MESTHFTFPTGGSYKMISNSRSQRFLEGELYQIHNLLNGKSEVSRKEVAHSFTSHI